jgi:hypothetical protein
LLVLVGGYTERSRLVSVYLSCKFIILTDSPNEIGLGIKSYILGSNLNSS